MHALQTIFLKATLPKGEKISGLVQLRIFFWRIRNASHAEKNKADLEEAKKNNQVNNLFYAGSKRINRVPCIMSLPSWPNSTP